MNTDTSDLSKLFRGWVSFLVLVLLWFFVLVFDHNLIGQILGFLKSGRFPDFAACTRLVAYLITSYATGKFAHEKYPARMVCCAFPLGCLLAALWLQTTNG